MEITYADLKAFIGGRASPEVDAEIRRQLDDPTSFASEFFSAAAGFLRLLKDDNFLRQVPKALLTHRLSEFAPEAEQESPAKASVPFPAEGRDQGYVVLVINPIFSGLQFRTPAAGRTTTSWELASPGGDPLVSLSDEAARRAYGDEVPPVQITLHRSREFGGEEVFRPRVEVDPPPTFGPLAIEVPFADGSSQILTVDSTGWSNPGEPLPESAFAWPEGSEIRLGFRA